jgi:hypothetical protein
MSRLKKSSPTIEKAEQRLAALKSISQTLDLGKGYSIDAFTDKIDYARQRVEAYNTTLSHVDSDRLAMIEAEKALAEFTENMLLGVAFVYGKNSREYEMAGGTRKRERKRPNRKKDTSDKPQMQD